MLALAIILGFLAALVMTYIAVYKIRPALLKVSAALWKIFTLNVEIRLPQQRSLAGKRGEHSLPGKADDERPDP